MSNDTNVTCLAVLLTLLLAIAGCRDSADASDKDGGDEEEADLWGNLSLSIEGTEPGARVTGKLLVDDKVVDTTEETPTQLVMLVPQGPQTHVYTGLYEKDGKFGKLML